MSVTLRVVAGRGFSDQTEMEFAQGCTIGRAGSNDLVLPDPERFISSHHAKIEARADGCYLVDTSINGTFVNAAEQPVGHGNSQRLSDGDRIRIGEYQIVVGLRDSATSQSSQWPREDLLQPGPVPQDFGSDLLSDRQSVDPLEHFGAPPPAAPTPPPAPMVSPADQPAQGYGSFTPPQPQRDPFAPALDDPLQGLPEPGAARGQPPTPEPPAAGGIPEDWDRTTLPPTPPVEPARDPFAATPQQGPAAATDPFGQAQPPQAPPRPDAGPGPDFGQPTPPVPQRNAASGPQPVQRSQAPAPAPSAPQAVPPSGQFSGAAQAGGGIAELLESAGIDQATAQALASPQMSQMLGMILRVTVRGLMDVLNARAEIKSQFRVSVTKIAPTENNPLKFCVDERDALQRLLHPGHGFLGPVEAVDEAFEDVKAHQMAMMAGMRAAFDQLMERFNPELLQKQFDRQLGRSLLPLNKNRYWDMLQELYADISRDSDANFARLFGDAFASAYEEQMEQLNLLRRRAQAGAADRNVR